MYVSVHTYLVQYCWGDLGGQLVSNSHSPRLQSSSRLLASPLSEKLLSTFVVPAQLYPTVLKVVLYDYIALLPPAHTLRRRCPHRQSF